VLECRKLAIWLAAVFSSQLLDRLQQDWMGYSRIQLVRIKAAVGSAKEVWRVQFLIEKWFGYWKGLGEES